MKEILTRKEIMKLFGISLSTVIRWEKRGILKPIKVTPRKIVYKRDDIENLLRERQLQRG